MFKTSPLVLFLGAAALGVVGCDKMAPRSGGSASTTTAATSGDPNAVVATMKDGKITEGELATAAKKQIAQVEAEHQEKLFAAKSQALEAMIDKRLIEAKAKAEGLTPEKLIEREVTSKATEPTAEEVQQVYDRTKASGRQLPPFEQVKGDIVNFLKDQKSGQGRGEFMAKLRKEANVEVKLTPPLPPKVEVAAEGPSKGPEKAPVTIVTFSDFECPFCSRAETTVKQVMDTYPGKIRLVFRDYPLPFHPNAQKASEAAHCAADQGKYWEMHEKLFANQQALTVPQLKEHAKGIGLDQAKFDKCLDGGDKASIVVANKKAGDEAGVSGTPAFFINGRMLSGAQPFEKFKPLIDAELAGKQ
jgi:protein-disulfide isomerase